MPLPARFKVESSGPRSLAVSWRWFSAKHVIFAVLSVMFIGFALLWGLIMGLVGDAAAGIGWSSIQLLVGAVTGYAAVAGFFNTTRVEASRDRLTLKHGPIPWRGNLVISRDDLAQLFAREDRSQDEDGVSVSYALGALDRAGRAKVLLAGLSKIEEALWLEQQIERAMAIEDFPVAGEAAKRSA